MITNKEVRISVNRTLTKKLFYVIAAVLMLAMLIPAMAMPVSAAGELSMYLVNPLTNTHTVIDGGYNITGSRVFVDATSVAPVTWSVSNQVTGTNASILVQDPATSIVSGVWGEALIMATTSGNATYSVDKKWGQISSTAFSAPTGYSAPPGSSFVTWNEGAKKFEGGTKITDTVYGDFVNKDGVHSNHPLQGTILNWYLVASYATVPTGPMEARGPNGSVGGLTKCVADLDDAKFVKISESGDTYYQSVTAADGTSTITLSAWGEESIKVVVVPEYPFNPQIPVSTEVTSWNFQTREMEVVPQVRWAGEKIVLEKNYTTAYHNDNVQQPVLYLVRFATTTPNAVLEAFGNTYIPLGGGNFSNTPQSVWTTVDANGLASVVLYYANQGQIDVVCTLYAFTWGNNQLIEIENQHAFTVYYLKLESLTLADVDGKRFSHNYGRWVPNADDEAEIWDTSTDMDSQTLNVSQDALERALVKGYFVGANLSTREAEGQDINNDGTPDLMLPANRWVLPDDWAKLAGENNWLERRIHWDIMDAPNDLITSLDPLGPYLLGQYTPVKGPFSPGIELMTPTGWDLGKTSTDSQRDMKTVVPNGDLDPWDAPMPPAKIIFEIMSGVGYFKDAFKTDIYYEMVGSVVHYTAPFYQSLIPAH